jgi:hypothetical protein
MLLSSAQEARLGSIVSGSAPRLRRRICGDDAVVVVAAAVVVDAVVVMAAAVVVDALLQAGAMTRIAAITIASRENKTVFPFIKSPYFLCAIS